MQWTQTRIRRACHLVRRAIGNRFSFSCVCTFLNYEDSSFLMLSGMMVVLICMHSNHKIYSDLDRKKLRKILNIKYKTLALL